VNIISFLFLFLFSVCVFGAPRGTWRQVFPEENGAIPCTTLGNLHMCSIGDQQALLIGSRARVEET